VLACHRFRWNISLSHISWVGAVPMLEWILFRSSRLVGYRNEKPRLEGSRPEVQESPFYFSH
jgi:hypothetical protein